MALERAADDPPAEGRPLPVTRGSPAARPGLAAEAGRSPRRAAPRARGAATNPAGRFETLRYLADPELADPETLESDHRAASGAERPFERQIPTRYLRDPARSAIARNQSPDIPFDASLNPYRGCVHGCAYCYARPTHEYLGFSAGLDFETRILVKEELPELLRRELSAPGWRPRVIAVSGVTDAYQPVERRLGLTRRSLAVLLEFRNPVSIITKSGLVARDTDLLAELAHFEAASVSLSINSLDPELARTLEPRAAAPAQRLRAVERLARAGVPVGVVVAPVIPGLNDHDMGRVLAAARDAGAAWAGMIVLRLPHGLKTLFDDWLDRHRPERRARVLARVKDVRGGRLDDPRFGSRMRGEGPYAEQLRGLFELQRRKLGLDAQGPELSTAHFRRGGGAQLTLF